VPSSTVGTAPSRPNSDGMYTVNPASRTQRLKRATCGLMPGISVMTITAGPAPATCTTFVMPSSVISRGTKSSSGSSSFMDRVGIAIAPVRCWRRRPRPVSRAGGRRADAFPRLACGASRALSFVLGRWGRGARNSLSSCSEDSTTNSSVTGVAHGDTKCASDAEAIPMIMAMAGAAPWVSPERRENSSEIASAPAAPIAKCMGTNRIGCPRTPTVRSQRRAKAVARDERLGGGVCGAHRRQGVAWSAYAPGAGARCTEEVDRGVAVRLILGMCS